MKTKAFAFASAVFLSVETLLAQGAAIADKCGNAGQPACTLTGLGAVIIGALTFIVKVATLFIVVMICYSALRLMLLKDKPYEFKEAKERLTRVVLGVLIISFIASITGIISLLAIAGVNPEFMGYIKNFFGIKSALLMLHENFAFIGPYILDHLPVAHAYADDTLPNPLVVTDLYGFLVQLFSLVVRWFVFPLMIYAWFYTGFMYILAQGNPQKLTEAHKWLWWSVIGTVIIMLSEGFLFAIKGTIGLLG